jgi:hypothetical protein
MFPVAATAVPPSLTRTDRGPLWSCSGSTGTGRGPPVLPVLGGDFALASIPGLTPSPGRSTPLAAATCPRRRAIIVASPANRVVVTCGPAVRRGYWRPQRATRILGRLCTRNRPCQFWAPGLGFARSSRRRSCCGSGTQSPSASATCRTHRDDARRSREEGTGQESSSQESPGQDSPGQESAGPKGAGPKGAGPSPEGAGPSPESAGQEGTGQEGRSPEGTGQEGRGPESAGQEGPGQKGRSPESAGPEGTGQEGPGQEGRSP